MPSSTDSKMANRLLITSLHHEHEPQEEEQMTFKSRLESGGEECPKCGSKAIKASARRKK